MIIDRPTLFTDTVTGSADDLPEQPREGNASPIRRVVSAQEPSRTRGGARDSFGRPGASGRVGASGLDRLAPSQRGSAGQPLGGALSRGVRGLLGSATRSAIGPSTSHASHAAGRPIVDERPQARLDLVLLACAVIIVGRFAEAGAAWIAAALLMAAMAFGSLRVFQAFGDARLARWPVATLVTPAIAAVGAFGAVRLVPLGLGLVPGVVGAAALVWMALDLENRVLLRPSGPTVQDRTAIIAVGLASAFLAFTGVAGLVPGGLVEPAASAGASATASQLSETSLIALAGADAFIALLVGYRFASLRVGHLRPAATAALGYAAAIAIAAGLVRAAALPRLLGPALLTLVLFLWDAIRGASPAARRDPRFVWQMALIAVLGIVVVAWNIGLRR